MSRPWKGTVTVLVMVFLLAGLAGQVGCANSAPEWESGWSTAVSGGDDYTLYGVWGTSPTNVYAVGVDDRSERGVILHYKGGKWSATKVGTVESFLEGVWGTSSSDVFAVGGHNTILHYDGTAWSAMTSASSDDDDLYAVWGTSPSDVFCVGRQGTIQHYDGNTWSLMKSSATKYLEGV